MNDRKTVLVTGGSRGIGAEVCRLAAADGWRVAVNYASDARAADKVVEAIEAGGGEAFAVKADVASEGDILDMFAKVDQRFGRIEGLVNNAGVVDRKARLDEMTLERLDRMMRVNVIGSMLCAREAVKRMSPNHGGSGGSIVNIGSVAAVLGAPGEYLDYAAAKGAMESFTYGLGRELAGEKIRVNLVRPGTIDTEIHASGGQPDRAARVSSAIPMQRPGTAQEVARAVVWLLSDASSYSTASVLTVSGGR